MASIFDRINFQLHPAERLALIGENGEGKTTIVKLMTRLYDPTEGQILLDGVDLRSHKFSVASSGASGADWRERRGQDHDRKVDDTALRPHGRADSAGWRRSSIA